MIQLPSAMVGDEDCVCTVLDGKKGILYRHDALEPDR